MAGAEVSDVGEGIVSFDMPLIRAKPVELGRTPNVGVHPAAILQSARPKSRDFAPVRQAVAMSSSGSLQSNPCMAPATPPTMGGRSCFHERCWMSPLLRLSGQCLLLSLGIAV